MKKPTRFMVMVIIVALILTMITGCKKQAEEVEVSPELMFVPEYVSLSDDIHSIENLVYMNGKLYFVSTNSEYADELFGYTYSAKIYTMNIEGTDVSELPDYTPPVATIPGADGGFQINLMQPDHNGNIWIYERWDYNRYDLPADFDAENDFPSKYDYLNLDSGSIVRKLDPTGRELFTIDNSSISIDQEWFTVQSLNIDADGNLYIIVKTIEGASIYVFDSNVTMRFKIDLTNMDANQLVRTPDGYMVFMNSIKEENGDAVRVLQAIDYNAGALGETFTIPQNTFQIHPGAGETDVIVNDGSTLYGLCTKTGETKELLRWIESGVQPDRVENTVMISQELIICTTYSYNTSDSERSYQLITLTIAPRTESMDDSVLTLAVFGEHNVRDAVAEFNRANPDYQINVVDYMAYSTDDDFYAGITKFSTEIIAGNIPDIICMTGLPYEQYVLKGLLVDLYPLIDADLDFSREDFVDGTLSAAEVKNGLYQIFPSFTISTIVGNPSVLGPNTGWNMNEFKSVLDANPNADIPLGNWITKTDFLRAVVSNSLDEYIDWSTGTTSFDTTSFVQILEFVNTLPTDLYNPKTVGTDSEGLPNVPVPGPEDTPEGSDVQRITEGRQIMAIIDLYCFEDYRYYKAVFANELVFKGFPTENGTGVSLNVDFALAITSKAENNDGAWQFLRTFLNKDYQISNTDRGIRGFPTNKAAFDIMLEQAIEESNLEIIYRDRPDGSEPIRQLPITQDDVNLIAALINSASGTVSWAIDPALISIITDGAEDYFNGNSTAQDAAKVIQSRASILVSEQSFH